MSIPLATKRVIDVSASAVLLVLLSPLFLLVALAVKLQDGGPVLFRHRRIGQFGHSFGCFKFRTMVVDAGERLEAFLASNPEARREWETHRKLTQDPRTTRIGAFLRSTSLDELPQLLNILSGEMSLVGPRPVTDEELSRYGSALHQYLSVRPGLTGLWQVSGRNECSYEQRVQMDAKYVREWSLWLDLIICLKTVSVVLSRRGSC